MCFSPVCGGSDQLSPAAVRRRRAQGLCVCVGGGTHSLSHHYGTSNVTKGFQCVRSLLKPHSNNGEMNLQKNRTKLIVLRTTIGLDSDGLTPVEV